MRRSEMSSPRLYQVKSGRIQPARPTLVLDTGFWDFTPAGESFTISPSTEGIQGSHILDKTTRARRGLPVLQVRPGVQVDDKTLQRLQKLLDRAKGIKDAVSRVEALRQEVGGLIVMNVVPPEYIVSPVDRPTVQYRCPGTEDVACGTPVSPDAASRLRRHDTPAGHRCPRTKTKLTSEERKAGAIAPAS